MPYKAKGKCVYKADTGEKVGCTKGPVKKYLAALYANVPDTKKESVGGDSLQVIQAVNVLANYIVANGDVGVRKVQELLNSRVGTLKHQGAVHEVIRSMIKDAINEMAAK